MPVQKSEMVFQLLLWSKEGMDRGWQMIWWSHVTVREPHIGFLGCLKSKERIRNWGIKCDFRYTAYKEGPFSIFCTSLKDPLIFVSKGKIHHFFSSQIWCRPVVEWISRQLLCRECWRVNCRWQTQSPRRICKSNMPFPWQNRNQDYPLNNIAPNPDP